MASFFARKLLKLPLCELDVCGLVVTGGCLPNSVFNISLSYPGADPAGRWGGGASLGGGGLTYPIFKFLYDLGHFILKLLNFDIYFFYFMLNFKFI